MFYTQMLLGSKGALGVFWLEANDSLKWDRYRAQTPEKIKGGPAG